MKHRMKNRIKRIEAFTLIELIVVMAIMGIFISISGSMMIFGMNVHEKTTEEYDIQSSMRLMSQKINTVARDSAGSFLLHRDDATNLTDKWNYIMLSADKTKMIEYRWDEAQNKHLQFELFSGLEGVTLDLVFKKNNAPDADRILEFTLTADIDGQVREINTEVESMNALQVVDRAYGKVANVLAYRNDDRLAPVMNSQAAVSMVLDTSGSMARNMDGNSSNYSNSRLAKMGVESIRLINEFAKNPNIYVSLNPFSTTANGSKVMVKAQANNGTNSVLVDYFDSDDFEADGGTNTGDGIRRGYYRIVEFNNLDENKTKTNKNFMIILVDGATSFASCTNAFYEVWDRTGYHGLSFEDDGYDYDYIGDTGSRYRYMHYDKTRTAFYLNDNGTSSNSFPEMSTGSYTNGRIAGNGSMLDPIGTDYVDAVGEMVRAYKKDTNEAIKVYVIGFSNVSSDRDSLADIAMATTGNTTFYTAGSSEALAAIFDAIQKEINDSLWHIGGPN